VRLIRARLKGSSFEGRQEILGQCYKAGLFYAWLVPDIDNPMDPDAVAVHTTYGPIGFIPKEHAKSAHKLYKIALTKHPDSGIIGTELEFYIK